MPKDVSVLFSGELPPDSLHGVSISNELNINILDEFFNLVIHKEYSNLYLHSNYGFQKFKLFFSNFSNFLILVLGKKYEFLYITMSTTKFGKVKFLTYTLIFRIFSRGKIVVHVHRGDLFKKNNRSKLTRFNHVLFNHCYKVIVLSRRDANILNIFSKGPNKFFVLENTVSTNLLKMRTAGGPDGHTCKFIFLSNYLEEKGILLLISVFEKLSTNFKLECYGNFSNKEIEKNLKSKLFKNVNINGSLIGDEKLKAIANSDCLILPSFNEGKPLVILEAMSIGTPVITFNVGFIQELLPLNYPFLIDQISPSALECAIRKFESYSIEQRKNLGVNLSTFFDANFSMKKHKEELLKIFAI